MEKRITLRHLEAFRAIMVRKTVTGAADMLGVTQPVVTRLLVELEQRIAIPLFKRTRGRLAATQEALLLFDEVHRSLVSIERIADAASGLKALKLGHIEIAAAPAMSLSFLPRVIANFTREHPDTLVTMHMHSSATVLDMIQNERCDLGFAMLPMRTSRHGHSKTLLSAKMVAVVPADHPLARRKILHPEDFAQQNFVSMPPLLEARTMIDAIFVSYGIQRRVNIETQISFAIIKLVEAGAGVSIIDPLSALGYTGDQLKFIPFEPEIITNYSIIVSPRKSRALILTPFIDYVRRELHALVPHHLIAKID